MQQLELAHAGQDSLVLIVVKLCVQTTAMVKASATSTQGNANAKSPSVATTAGRSCA